MRNIILVLLFGVLLSPPVLAQEQEYEEPARPFDYNRPAFPQYGHMGTFVDFHGFITQSLFMYEKDGPTAGRHTFGNDSFYFWAGAKISENISGFGEIEYLNGGSSLYLDRVYIDYTVSPAINYRFGKFYMPLGTEVEDYAPPLRKFISRPMPNTELLYYEWDDIGVEVFGTIPAGKSSEFLYNFALVNGPKGVNTADKQTIDNNAAKTSIFRLSYRPSVLTEFGGSFSYGSYDPAEKYYISFIESHFRWNSLKSELRGEYLYRTHTTSAGLHTSSGFYLHYAYAFIKNGPSLSLLEGAIRYDQLDYDWATVSNADKRRISLDLTLSPAESKNLLFKVEYENKWEAVGPALADNAFLARVVLQF